MTTVGVKREAALKHVQIREYVRSLVCDAEPGSAAPSERELVARFGVARMTVRQALDALVSEGLLERLPGRGTFVARPRRRAGELTSFTEDMRLRGLLPESQTLIARRQQAGPKLARALRISLGDAIIHWRRLRRADGQVMCVEDAYLNEVLIPGFLQRGMPTSLYDALEERGLRPTWAEDAISAESASAELATLLEVQPGDPALLISRRAFAGDMAIEVSRAHFRADRFAARVELGA